MTQAARIRADSRVFWATPLAVFVALAVGACAAPGPSGNDPLASPITEFDEPEHRKRARLRMELATGYFEQGRTDIALDEIKQALAADATFVPAYTLRGLVFMQMNNPRLAEDSFQRALQLNPRDPDALHNYGWFLCQQGRHAQGVDLLNRALASPVYGGQARTYMAKGVCQVRMGQIAEAEGSLARSYELDPGNPIAAYNLAQLLFRRGENERAQFIVRRLNNSEFGNAETLWLGIKIERRLGNAEVVEQLATQLGRRFAESSQWNLYQRGAFHE
ncbi:MAG TPA: type IV pilus biogenesis/stability protein PilW [Hydrogenophaga sp.]|uniref:type IV pilus biogenesis/stability protein PilW n=1 Tax=Hydrogenophaga sp. TaxID=1904254 RepID=UPI002CD5B109|nr:type IV pilus biogenesis/stability protein PilW [Hydrogenophaga sp.]HMN91859.1 type IV pilus biogenesis/stability protein PilW [Hydrogenophaga sp.]HMP09001.1 type IV pilus biogenesis/stability protein PilW [Hydrogenophaga sp.]